MEIDDWTTNTTTMVSTGYYGFIRIDWKAPENNKLESLKLYDVSIPKTSKLFKKFQKEMGSHYTGIRKEDFD